MENLRRVHNDEKRELISRVTRKGDSILDVGCGFGGDLKKWENVGANINMCEPNEEALQEAKQRAKKYENTCQFLFGRYTCYTREKT